MKNSIRIASGQGFWGDLQDAPVRQVTAGPIDYLVMDYLAEVTMSILQKQKRKDPRLGYATDFPAFIGRVLPELKAKGIRVIANAGGVNVEACAEAVFAEAKKLGVTGLTIGIVTGDNILDEIDALLAKPEVKLANMETGEPLATVRDLVISANVYFGAFPIVEALAAGADIVITGRSTDTGLTLAPMIHEFGWTADDWDKLAAGTVAGHILECGGQASGGNFLGDWRAVPDLAHIGFPIVEARPDGTFTVTKHESLGGLVSPATVKEQLLYEIGDPAQYITPDVVADFTTIQLTDDGPNRVGVHGIGGRPCTPFYKVSAAYSDGYMSGGTLTYTWPEALDKAKAADQILRTRLADLGLTFDEMRTEFVGVDACHGPLTNRLADPEEVQLRVGVRGHDLASVTRFGMELAPLILTGPPSVTGFAGGRPKPREVVAYWPALIPKTAVTPSVELREM